MTPKINPDQKKMEPQDFTDLHKINNKKQPQETRRKITTENTECTEEERKKSAASKPSVSSVVNLVKISC
jgi:hypothetical protein